MNTQVLSWLLIIPALAALVVLLLPRAWEGVIRRFSIAVISKAG